VIRGGGCRRVCVAGWRNTSTKDHCVVILELDRATLLYRLTILNANELLLRVRNCRWLRGNRHMWVVPHSAHHGRIVDRFCCSCEKHGRNTRLIKEITSQGFQLRDALVVVGMTMTSLHCVVFCGGPSCVKKRFCSSSHVHSCAQF